MQSVPQSGTGLRPPAVPEQTVVNVALLQTIRDLERGEIERPLQLLDRILRLNRDLRSDFTPEAIERFSKRFQGKRGSVGLFLFSLIGADDMSRRAEQFDVRLALMTEADYRGERKQVNDYFRQLLERTALPVPEARPACRLLKASADKSLFLSVLAPDIDRLLPALVRSTAYLAGSRCLIALRLWQLEGKALPADLDSVVRAAGMKGVPTDPYSNAPLKMALLGG